MNKYTKDPVKILISKINWLYDFCIENKENFTGKDEYEVIKELLNTIKTNHKSMKSKAVLQLIKDK